MASKTVKQFVRFKAPFTKEMKEEIPGRDLAEFLAEKLRAKGLAVRSVENDEIWFTVNVNSGSIEYPVMVCQSSMEDDFWEISCPRTLGTFTRLFGKSEEVELQNLVNILDELLYDDKSITDINWYGDFSELSDSYAKTTCEKRLTITNKYLYKLFLPLGVVGFALTCFDMIPDGQAGIIGKLGLSMFMFVFCAFFSGTGMGIVLPVIFNGKDVFRGGLKKNWFKLFLILFLGIPFCFFGLMFIWFIIRIWISN